MLITGTFFENAVETKHCCLFSCLLLTCATISFDKKKYFFVTISRLKFGEEKLMRKTRSPALNDLTSKQNVF